jgi:hypothetical protein
MIGLPEIPVKSRNYLIGSYLLTKLFIGIALAFWIDSNDLWTYARAAGNVAAGSFPWAHDVGFFYPPLAMVPVGISYLISGGIHNFYAFEICMSVMNSLFDLVIIFSIYWIGLKLYSRRTAFVAAMLYATGFSIAYYSLTRYDAFPACLAMLAILFVVYGKQNAGYGATLAGLFTKLWPIALYPFLWIYRSDREPLRYAAGYLALGLGLFAAMFLLGYNAFADYFHVVYGNTVVYAIGQYAALAGFAIPINALIVGADILTALIVIYALGRAYFNPPSLSLMLKMILLCLIAGIFLSSYRSPQYIVWYSPLLALLVADRLSGISLFVVVQALAVIEYPLTYLLLWNNYQYLNPLGLLFFTVLFVAYGALVLVALGFGEGDIKKNCSVIVPAV